MKKYLFALAIVFLTSNAFAQKATTYNAFTGKFDHCVWVEEEDSDPANATCGKLLFPSGSITDNGDGSYSISTSGTVDAVGNDDIGTPELDDGSESPTAGDFIIVDGDTMGVSYKTAAEAIDAGTNLTWTGTTLDVDNPVVANLTGNATTATALAANGANCSAGSAPLGVDASGAAESCTDYEEDLSNSAGLAAALSDETGTGLAVFATSPTFTTSIIMGAADLGEAELEILDGATITTAELETLSDGSDADTLHVHSGASLNDDIFLLTAGDTMTGTLVIDNEFGIQLEEASGNGDNLVGIKAADSLTADVWLQLGDDLQNCAAGEVLEVASVGGSTITIECDTDGGGAGTPGGSDTQVQFNDGGSFGGDAGMTYNKTTDSLTLVGTVTAAIFDSSGTASPTVSFKDSDATAGDVNARIDVNCTDTGDGTEDCDIDVKQQIAGTETTVMAFDADGSITSNQKFIADASLDIKNGTTSSGVLAIFEDSDNGTNNATFIVPALTADTDYTLPPDDGDAGEQLQTDGAGVLTWEAAGSGTGAFSDAGDPIVQNTITKDVHVGDGVGTLTGKLEVGGDADQPQVVIEGHSTQTDDLLIVQQDDDTELFSISPSPSIKLLEVADAPADTAGYGQIWVNTATPNELYFTDDAGTDFQLGVGGATNWDSIGDPSGDGTVAFGTTEQLITSDLDDATAGTEAALTIQNIQAIQTEDASLLDLQVTDDDDQSSIFLRALDNNTEEVIVMRAMQDIASAPAAVTITNDDTLLSNDVIALRVDYTDDGDSNQIAFQYRDNSATDVMFQVSANGKVDAGQLFLLEQADASADVAGYGQIWVNTATPNELWFTNDAGTDTQLGVGSPGADSITTSELDDNEKSPSANDFLQVDSSGTTIKYSTLAEAVGAGTNLSLSGTTFNVDDVFTLTAGDTVTGTIIHDNEFGIEFQEASGNGDNLVAFKAADTLGGDVWLELGDDLRTCAVGEVLEVASVGGSTVVLECDTDGGGGGTARLTVELPVQSAKISGSFVTDGDATQGAQIDAGDGNWRLLFDATTDEGAVWGFRMPNNYSSAPLLKVGYSMASATTLEVEFEGAIMCVSDGDSADIGTASFSAIAVASATVPGTAGHLDEVSITLTDDSCAANDFVYVYLSTDADDATNDDATGDREVVYVTLQYTGS